MLLQFELDPQIIHHIIYSQAGSIGKALIELIMNSVDAEATTVHLDVTNSGFAIRDDGHGFASREDVLRYFGRFGTPHMEGDATFGRFRLGRGQIMAHASTRWESNSWQMTVDTWTMGYAYDLEELSGPKLGCAVQGTWYEALDEREYLSAIQELRDLVRYTPVTVHLNGKTITRKPSEEAWEFEDDFAYYRLRREGAMAIYNQGVLVRHDPGHYWGVGGIIVTKKAIALNVSRTEILRKTCPIWQSVARQIKKLASEFLAKEDPRRKTENSRHLAAKTLLAGGADILDLVEGEDVITILPGNRHISLSQFGRMAAQCQGIAVVPSGADLAKAETIAACGLALVIHPRTIERFDSYDCFELEESLRRVQGNIQAAVAAKEDTRGLWGINQALNPLNFVSYDVLRTNFVERMEVLKDDELKDKEVRRAWVALRWCLQQYADLIRGAGGENGRLRLSYGGTVRRYDSEHNHWLPRMTILLGRSNVADAWTDGKSYIAVNIKVVQRLAKDGLNAASYIFSLIEHEVAHEGDSLGAVHDEAFYSRFHDLSVKFADRRQWYIHKWLVKYARSAEMEGKWGSRRDRYGWAGNHLRMVERAGNGRRSQGTPGLIEDISGSEDLADAVDSVDEAMLAFINAGLVSSGVCPPPPDWAKIEADSQEIRQQRQAEKEARNEELAQIAAWEEDIQQGLEETRIKVIAALGLQPGEIDTNDVLNLFEGVDPERWPAVWADYTEECKQHHQEYLEWLETARADLAQRTGRDKSSITDEEAEKHSETREFLYGDESGPHHRHGGEDSELIQEFQAANGRPAEDNKELELWRWAGKPNLAQGESMWMIKRNAAVVGLTMRDYVEWKASQN